MKISSVKYNLLQKLNILNAKSPTMNLKNLNSAS